MKIKITRNDGTSIEVEGTIEECQVIAAMYAPVEPAQQPETVYVPVYIPSVITTPSTPSPWEPQVLPNDLYPHTYPPMDWWRQNPHVTITSGSTIRVAERGVNISGGYYIDNNVDNNFPGSSSSFTLMQ